MNNPYKRIGGDSLDQALFKKREQPAEATPSPSSDKPPTTNEALNSNSPNTPFNSDAAIKTQRISDNLKSTPHNPATSKSSASKPRTSILLTRSFIKRAFDLYEDQLSYLTRESLQDRLAGKEGSMNAMVREAIDDWIKKREAGK